MPQILLRTDKKKMCVCEREKETEREKRTLTHKTKECKIH